MKEFLLHISEAAKAFKPISVKIVAHPGADGIAAAALLALTFQQIRIPYSCTFAARFDGDLIETLKGEPYETFLFVDLGSSYAQEIHERLIGKNILVFEHHPGQAIPGMLNPLHFGGFADSFNSAGIAYFFCKEIFAGISKYAHLALIGALGDRQNIKGELHQLILEDASSLLSVRKGIQMLGYQTRSLKFLLPEIGAKVDILAEAGLESSKRLHDLTPEQIERLAKALERGLSTPVSFEDHYLLQHEQDPLYREGREFASLLSACGKLGKASLAMGVCVGDPEAKRKAAEYSVALSKELLRAQTWMHEHPDAITSKQGLVIVRGGTAIPSEVTGIIAERMLEKGSQISVVVAHVDAKGKVSIRSRRRDCLSLLQNLLAPLGGSAHGHANAAGGTFPLPLEDRFLKSCEQTLGRMQMEETLES